MFLLFLNFNQLAWGKNTLLQLIKELLLNFLRFYLILVLLSAEKGLKTCKQYLNYY